MPQFNNIFFYEEIVFEEEPTEHKEDGHKIQQDYAIASDTTNYKFNLDDVDDRVADAGLCADYSLADLCADYSLSEVANYKKKGRKNSSGTQSAGGTPKTSSFREKLEKRYSVHDMHFAGYPSNNIFYIL